MTNVGIETSTRQHRRQLLSITMGLLNLPNEILLLIAECLSYSWDLSVFSQINKRLYNLLNAYVYQHNIRYFDGYVLSWAAQYGSEITARKMLDAGARSILSCESPERSPMALSVKHGNEPVLRLFLVRGIMNLGVVAQWDDPWDNPLKCAVEDGHETVVRLLLAHGWQPDPELSKHAARAGHLSMLKLIIEAQSKPNFEGPGYGPITYAVDGSHLAVVQYLLQAGADPNSNKGYPLTRATELGHLEMVRCLLEHGADANYTEDGLKGLPIVNAIKHVQTAVATLLFEWTDFSKFLTCGYSRGLLLRIAAACGSDIHVLQLLESGVPEKQDVDAEWGSDTMSCSPLQLAAIMGHEHIVKLLLERSTTGEPPMDLMEAAIQSGNKSLVQMLFDNGFKIRDIPDLRFSWKRKSILFNAVCGGPDMLDCVLANGLRECLYPVYEGASAVREAMRGETPSMLARLMDLGSIPYVERHSREEELPSDLCRLASVAAKEGHYAAEAEAIIDILLSHGACINSTTGGGRTPLSLYCDIEYDARPVKFLLEKGACPLDKDVDLETPLSLAVSRAMEKDGIKYLLQAISPRYIDRDDLEEELAKCEGKAVRRKKWTNVMMLQRFKDRLENDPWIYEDCN